MKWLWEASIERYPIDHEKLFSNIPMYAAVTDIETGNADYHRIQPDTLANVLEATTALPIAYRDMPCFSGGCYTDGGVADSIPVRKAYRLGARDITVVLSHPLSYEKQTIKYPWLVKKLLSQHPNIAKSMMVRATNYNESLEFIKNPPSDLTIRVIAPPEEFNVKRLTMNKAALNKGYLIGKQAGQTHIEKNF